MNKKRGIVLLLLASGLMVSAQDKAKMQDFQSRLSELIVRVAEAPTSIP